MGHPRGFKWQSACQLDESSFVISSCAAGNDYTVFVSRGVSRWPCGNGVSFEATREGWIPPHHSSEGERTPKEDHGRPLWSSATRRRWWQQAHCRHGWTGVCADGRDQGTAELPGREPNPTDVSGLVQTSFEADLGHGLIQELFLPRCTCLSACPRPRCPLSRRNPQLVRLLPRIAPRD